MSTSLDCFKYTNGLSRTSCNCFDDDKPSDFDVSDSGLFIDETEGLNLVYPLSAAECGRGNLWELMESSRDEGALYWNTTVMNYIGERTLRKRKYFSGVIGDDRTNRTKTNFTNNFAGLSMKLSTVRGGVMRLKRVAMFFESATPIDVFLYDNDSDVPLYSWNITPVAGRVEWYTLPIPIDISLVREVPRAKQLWLMYATSGAPRPLQHYVTCGCGELKNLNKWTDNPSFANLSTPQARYNWLEWMVVSGTTGNSLTLRETDWHHNNLGYGLMIDAEFICNANEIICADALDYTNDELAMVQAYGLRYAQAERLVDKILSSTKLNRFTMLDREALYGKRSHFKKEMDTRAKYVAHELTKPDRINLINDCFSCKDKFGFVKGNILIT